MGVAYAIGRNWTQKASQARRWSIVLVVINGGVLRIVIVVVVVVVWERAPSSRAGDVIAFQLSSGLPEGRPYIEHLQNKNAQGETDS